MYTMYRVFHLALILIIMILAFLLLGFNVGILFNIVSYSNNLEKNVYSDAVIFNNYMVNFNKSYSGSEYLRRLQNFKVSLAEIDRLNALEGDTVFGLTQFTDMSAQEFAQKMLLKPSIGDNRCVIVDRNCQNERDASSATKSYWDNMTVPDKFDWRKEGYVSPVLDQKLCNGCWAFAVVGVMETMAAKQNITKEPLSRQELIDCSAYNDGCRNGKVASALKFICIKNLGIVSAAKYPLTLRNEKCQRLPAGDAVTVKHYKYNCLMEEEDILRAIVHHGPVTTIVNASPWFNYIGGIIRRACVRNANSRHHAVQIVGYDKTGAIPYYIVKNSWGPLFGDNGYVKVAIYENVCGIREEIAMIDVRKIKIK